ncbi:putative polysaccharide biosynthesis protein [Veillonella agrestimuris]|uniref:putative polysaccharide biosynthesis protein n=1 Tax=Veillonella agrestimuris TaxID=2941340 RepID=UPI00203D2D0F|nr:polysaccharide biosynthesis protein [Veillonella agrestimuris]
MNRFLKGAMILTIAGIIVKVIGAFSKVLIARILGGEGIGLYMMAYPIYQIIVSISAAGIPVAISIMIAEKLANNDMRGVNQVFKVSLRVLAVVGIVFSFGLYASAEALISWGIITDPRALVPIQLLAPAIFVVTVLSCFRGYFQGFQYMVPTGMSQVFEQIFRVGSMVGLAYYFIHEGLHLAAGGATFATFPGVLAGLFVLIYFYNAQRTTREQLALQQNKLAPIETNGAVIKRLFALAIPVSMANIMLPMVSLIDTFIVPKRLMDIGYYLHEATTQFGYLTGMATSLIGLPIILTTSLAASLVPAVSEAHAQNDKKAIINRAGTSIKIANLLAIPACIGLSVLATPISMLIYATPHAGPVIAVISLSIIFLGWQQITAAILQGLGRTVIPMCSILIGLVVKAILDYQLTGTTGLGINGAAWATNMNFAIAAAINIYFVNKYVGSIVRYMELLKILISAMAMGGATQVIYTFVLDMVGNAFAVAISISAAIIVYGVSLWITKAIVKDDMYNLPIIGKRLRKRKLEEEGRLYEQQY